MQRFQSIASHDNLLTKTPALRALPCVHLPTGDAVGAFVLSATAFDDHVRSHLFSSSHEDVSLGDWIYDQITTLEVYCKSVDFVARPLVLPMPDISVNKAGDVLAASTSAIAQTHFCPQEISLEVSSAAIASNAMGAKELINTLRRNGFRVSIDARKYWQLNLTHATWLMIDTLRFDARHLDSDESLEDLLYMAAQAGVAIVAENGKWRDAEYFQRLGVDYGFKLRADC